MEYNELLDIFAETYKECLIFEDHIKNNMVEKEEQEEYAKEKAEFLLNVINLLIARTMANNNEYTKELGLQEFNSFEDELADRKIDLTEFDRTFIALQLENHNQQ